MLATCELTMNGTSGRVEKLSMGFDPPLIIAPDGTRQQSTMVRPDHDWDLPYGPRLGAPAVKTPWKAGGHRHSSVSFDCGFSTSRDRL